MVSVENSKTNLKTHISQFVLFETSPGFYGTVDNKNTMNISVKITDVTHDITMKTRKQILSLDLIKNFLLICY